MHRWVGTAFILLLAAMAPCRADSVLRAILANGMKVVIVPDHLAPVVTTEMNYLVGSNDAPPGFPGTAHALEHMMFRGSEGLDRDQLALTGALLGGDYNADTTEAVTQYTYTVPAADLNVPLKIEALRMHGLRLSQADWEQERGAIEQEVARDLSNPFYLFLTQAQSILFQGTPYQHDALGTRESFDKTDAARLRRFYDTWYYPNNAILVITGDVDPQAVLAQVRGDFDAIPAHELPGHAAIFVQPVQARTLNLPTDFPVGLIALAYRMPGLRSADYAAADLLGDVLGSERGSLYALVPAGKALAAQFSYQAKPDVGYGLAIAAFPAGQDPAPLLARVRGVIAGIVHDGVPPELVEAAKRLEVAQIGFQANSISGLATNWSDTLAFRNMASPEDVIKAYQSVTVADVNRLARQLLDPDHVVTAILTPRQSGTMPSKSGFGGAESFASAPDHPVILPPWVETALATPHIPNSGQPPSVQTLPNGIRLIVQPEHVSNTVSLFGRVRMVPDMQQPAGKDGVSALMRQLFSYGTTKHDRLAFQAATDDIAAFLDAGPNFSLQVLTPEFERGVALLAENVLHPAFPQSAFDVVRKQLADSVAGQLRSPDYQYRLAIEKAILPAGDPALRQVTPTSVNAVTLPDVRKYFTDTMRPDRTTIVVIGDITPDAAKRVIQANFGSWTARDPKPTIDLPPIGPSRPSELRVQDPSDQQDSVTLAETTSLPITNPERYDLLLGNTILSSGFSSRLYRDLRIRTGYVYSIDSSFDWSRTRGDYSVSFGADPQNIDKARALVLSNLKRMQTEAVSDSELARAKAELLRQLTMSRASVRAIAAQYLRITDLDLPMDAADRAAKAYAEMTADAVRQAFAKWVRPDDLATVVKGP
ncbi:MAG TPA: pitrilysin family protein [Rhodopila sp.]|uniref:M16 family metallopeptidase n=1 Tax=Rhodopila sp. TaxID=2480087 RepID=UPI002BE31016|nr:pitrilysin family protein [Rhodopila sp.]HVY18185.1 pitrilysin family protein [Rhodopila sp.]